MKKTSLLDVAKRVNWYEPPEALLRDPPRLLAQVMARGNVEDILVAREHFAEDEFRAAYRSAPPGLFDRGGWRYWGLVLFGSSSALPFPVRFEDAEPLNWRGGGTERDGRRPPGSLTAAKHIRRLAPDGPEGFGGSE